MQVVTTLLAIGSVVFCALALHPFITYPLSLILARKLISARQSTPGKPGVHQISIVFCAYNEQDVLSAKLGNLLAIRQELSGYDIEILVYDDGSSDRTLELLQGNSEVIVVAGHSRAGKSVGMNLLLDRARGEIVLLTDANVLMTSETVKAFAAAFADEGVAIAAGRLVQTNGETATAEVGAAYWRFEEWLKSLESETGSVIGANGSAFAMRRALFRPAPADVDDDFYTSMRLLTCGYRVVHCSDAIVFERSTSRPSEEWDRKIRIACRGMNCHRHLRSAIYGLSRWDRYKYYSHKWIRWFTALWLILSVVCILAAVASGFGWRTGLETTASVGAGLLLIELLGRLQVPLVSTVREGLSSLIATLLGVWHSFRGARFETWTPSASARNATSRDDVEAPPVISLILPISASTAGNIRLVEPPSFVSEGAPSGSRSRAKALCKRARGWLERQPAAVVTAVFVLYLVTCGSNWGLTNWTSPARRSLLVLSALIGLWWGGRTPGRQTWFCSALDPALLPLVTILGLSALLHLNQWTAVTVGLWFLAASVLVYFLLQDLLANRRLTVEQLADGLLLGSFPVLVDGIVRSVASGARAVGVFEHPNYFGGLAAMTIPLALAGWQRERSGETSSFPRWPYQFYLLMSATGLALSGSRGALLGLLGSAALLLPHRLLLYGAAAAVPLLAAGIAARWESVTLRLPVYGYTLRGIAEQPLWGHGLFTFRFPQPPYVHLQAHNVFLQIAYEVGLVGLAVVLVLLFQLLRDQSRTQNPSRPPWTAVLVASAVQQMVDVTWMSPGMFLWLAVVLAAWTWQPNAAPRVNQRFPGEAFAGLACSVLGLGFGFGHVPMSFFEAIPKTSVRHREIEAISRPMIHTARSSRPPPSERERLKVMTSAAVLPDPGVRFA